MKHSLYVWFDKVDKTYMVGSAQFARSERAICRGYLASFEHDKRMNPKEFELRRIGAFDDETGEWLLTENKVVDVMQVYERPESKDGQVVDE